MRAFVYNGLAGRPFWNAALLAPRFLVSAFCSGPAIMLVLLQILRRRARLDLKEEAIWKIAELMAYAMFVNLFFTAAEVFKETYNRMLSGYLLRDVVNLVDNIHFQSKDEIFTLAHLYESMLKEMRDAAGDSGEFYTPRPVVKLIVDRVKPRLSQTVLDPACGTGGFLVEAYEYLKPKAKNAKEQEILQTKTLFGVEKKPGACATPRVSAFTQLPCPRTKK